MQCTCGFENAADAKFCGKCRLPLGAGVGGVVPNAANAVAPARLEARAGRSGGRGMPRGLLAAVALVAVVAAAGYWWLNRPPDRYKADNSGLYPIKVDGKYGFMDRTGNTVITPQFDETGGFSEGLAAVRIGNKFGYINTKGEVVITPQFDGAAGVVSLPVGLYEFRSGRAVVVLGGRYGFIDKDGRYSHNPDLRSATWFSGEVAAVTTEAGEAAFVNRSGKVVMSGKFEEVGSFAAGLAPAASGGKWGYIDATGTWVIDPQFEEARNFADGLAPVKVGGRWGYIDQKGKFAVNPQYDSGNEFSEGYAGVNSGGAFSLIDTKGHEVGDAKFAAVGPFTEGLARVKVGDYWGFIDTTGKIVIRPQFDIADEYQNGLARVTIAGKEAYVTTVGAFVVAPFQGRVTAKEGEPAQSSPLASAAPGVSEPNSGEIVGDGPRRAIVSEIGSLLGKETPAQIIDRGACPYEGCKYGEKWMARADIDAYDTPPEMFGVAPKSLRAKAVIRKGAWVTTVTGIVIAKRHGGRVDLVNRRTSYANGVTNGPPLKNGQVVAIYSYVGEGCYTSLINGKSYVVCSLETDSSDRPQEWWIQVKTADGTKAWVLSGTRVFVSQEGLNSELGQTIEDPKMTLQDKLVKVDLLLREGADLNGDGGRHGTSATEGVIKTKDVQLLGMILSRGLNLRKPCPAYVASQHALEPGGALMLEALLENGMQLGCLTEPPLHAFLRLGIAQALYPVDRAIRVAEVLVKNGAVADQRDSQGASIFDMLDDPRWASRVAPLRQALVTMGAARKPAEIEKPVGSPRGETPVVPPPPVAVRPLNTPEALIEESTREDQDSGGFPVHSKVFTNTFDSLWDKTNELLAKNKDNVVVADKDKGLIVTALTKHGSFPVARYDKYCIVFQRVNENATRIVLKALLYSPIVGKPGKLVARDRDRVSAEAVKFLDKLTK